MRKPKTTCHYCGIGVYVRPSQMETQESWYCSKECNGLHKRQGSCAMCGKAIRSQNRTCSRACANRSRTGISYTGANSKNNASSNSRRRALVVEADGPNCKICSMEPIWQGKPLLFEVDHIDGNNKNHTLENLRLLCPNCHAQTETYGAKNIGRSAIRRSNPT